MKKLILFLFGMFSIFCHSAEMDFTIAAVGASNNTNTVFINTVETVEGTTCTNTKLLRLPDSDKLAEMFLSVALAGQAQGRKITVAYDPSICVSNGTLVTVFTLKN